MTAEETEASFDLTIDLTTESEINTTAVRMLHSALKTLWLQFEI